jgi:glycosyltransferase involved in cell wall biosynthesis
MPTIHLIAPFHTVPTLAASHCAFTQKALRFSKMMHLVPGYKIIEYANEGSESEADEKVVMLTADEYKQHYKPEATSPGAQAVQGTLAANLFQLRLHEQLRERSEMGDIVAHVFGPALYATMAAQLPGLIHVETGIGYPWTPFGAVPIFESYAWQHYQFGRFGNQGGGIDGHPLLKSSRTFVIPNYFDVDDWTFSSTPENAVVFMSRFAVDKGIHMLRKVIKAWHKKHPDDGMKFLLAGMGEFDNWFKDSDFSLGETKRIEYLGAVAGSDRADLIGRGKAFILPTIFVEPFGGAAVEAMMCGTPVVTPDFGAFTETVVEGVTGFRCRTVEQYVEAIEIADSLPRNHVRAAAEARYSLEACAPMYDAVFRELTTRASIE